MYIAKILHPFVYCEDTFCVPTITMWDVYLQIFTPELLTRHMDMLALISMPSHWRVSGVSVCVIPDHVTLRIWNPLWYNYHYFYHVYLLHVHPS